MTDDLPTADALAAALRALTDHVFWKDRRLLLAQLRQPERTVSCNALRVMTRRESCVDTRLAYGRLARRIGHEAGWTPPRKGMTWMSALSETLPENVEGEGVRWRLRPAAAEALVLAGWVAPDPTTDTERL